MRDLVIRLTMPVVALTITAGLHWYTLGDGKVDSVMPVVKDTQECIPVSVTDRLMLYLVRLARDIFGILLSLFRRLR